MRLQDFNKLNNDQQHIINNNICNHIGILTIDIEEKEKQLEIKEKYHYLININYIRNTNKDKDNYKRIINSMNMSYIAVKTAYNIKDI